MIIYQYLNSPIVGVGRLLEHLVLKKNLKVACFVSDPKKWDAWLWEKHMFLPHSTNFCSHTPIWIASFESKQQTNRKNIFIYEEIPITLEAKKENIYFMPITQKYLPQFIQKADGSWISGNQDV